MSGNVLLTVNMYVLIEELSGPHSSIQTYDEYACIGWLDKHGYAHGGSVALATLAPILFPDEGGEEGR